MKKTKTKTQAAKYIADYIKDIACTGAHLSKDDYIMLYYKRAIDIAREKERIIDFDFRCSIITLEYKLLNNDTGSIVIMLTDTNIIDRFIKKTEFMTIEQIDPIICDELGIESEKYHLSIATRGTTTPRNVNEQFMQELVRYTHKNASFFVLNMVPHVHNISQGICPPFTRGYNSEMLTIDGEFNCITYSDGSNYCEVAFKLKTIVMQRNYEPYVDILLKSLQEVFVAVPAHYERNNNIIKVVFREFPNEIPVTSLADKIKNNVKSALNNECIVKLSVKIGGKEK